MEAGREGRRELIILLEFYLWTTWNILFILIILEVRNYISLKENTWSYTKPRALFLSV